MLAAGQNRMPRFFFSANHPTILSLSEIILPLLHQHQKYFTPKL
jgi:hypothetical protein